MYMSVLQVFVSVWFRNVRTAILLWMEVCSDEPGLYIEGSHGIRTENQMFCKKAEKNEYGQFLCFEFLTYVPIDTEPLDTKLMTDEDVVFLNEYHAQVYEKISPYLNGEEKEWLRQATQPVKKA